MTIRTFITTVEQRRGGGIAIKLPFEASAEWGTKDRHDVSGTIDGHQVRGRLRHRQGADYLDLGPAWCRDASVAAGAQVAVSLAPEGPQMGSLPPDFAAALAAEPQARQFFESLATFYRKNFVRSIEQAKRPDRRAKRIADSVAALKARRRER